jgi:hypothetical protein
MAFIDLHGWPLTALFAVLLALSLSMQGLPAARHADPDTAVCEKAGLIPLGFVLSLH